MKKSQLSQGICLLALTLVGCIRTPVVDEQPKVDPMRVELSEAAIAADRSLQTVAEMEQQQSALKIEVAPEPASFGMARLATVNWVGNLEPLVRKIAEITQYRLKVWGDEPAMPVLVSIHQKNTLIGDILRQATLQSHNRVQIVVFPESRVIEMRYNE